MRRRVGLKSTDVGIIEWPLLRLGLHRSMKSAATARKCCVSNSRACIRPLSPQSVNSTSHPCCTLHEWLVSPPRGSTELYADAAFSTLRAHAARKPNSHNGLYPVILRPAASRPLGAMLADTHGPEQPFSAHSKCCGADRHCGHSPQRQSKTEIRPHLDLPWGSGFCYPEMPCIRPTEFNPFGSERDISNYGL